MDYLIRQAAERIAYARHLVISTGAGVSKESGVPTFRDALDGLWAQYDPTELATPQAFQRNPKRVWDWYTYRREMVSKTHPNPGHYALAELEGLLPKVVLITQNVDNHHQLAGSRDIIPLHGNLFAFKCSTSCQGNPTSIDLDSLAPWNPEDGPPRCPYCNSGYVRPDVVWFHETLPEAQLTRAFEEAQNCDVMLVVGTSGAVYPAAWIPIKAAERGAFLIEVNPQPSELTRAMNIHLAAPSGEVLPQVVEVVKQLLHSS
jgi:NAD-dependent deacetylase